MEDDFKHSEFASKVVQLISDSTYDFQTIFNGLAIVTATMLLSYVEDAQGIAEEALHDAVADYSKNLNSVITFAKAQIDSAEEAI
jgi:hypothetical protein